MPLVSNLVPFHNHAVEVSRGKPYIEGPPSPVKVRRPSPNPYQCCSPWSHAPMAVEELVPVAIVLGPIIPFGPKPDDRWPNVLCQ